MNAIVNAATTRKRKLTALPLLVVLFVISHFLLTKLVIEQDKTIDSQRSLIHMLFKDNVYLSMLHKHAGTAKKAQAGSQPQAGNPASQNSAAGKPGPAQVPSTQVPASKVGPTANAKNDRKTRKAEKSRPVPPAELTDPSDMRRVSFSI